MNKQSEAGAATERRIVLWRHGRTAWNAERRFQGQSDIPLDSAGISQAERAAGMLVHLAPHRIVSSDLSRAHATAQALARVANLEVSTDPRLRETNAGEWEGLQRTELLDRFGAQVAQWASDSYARPGGGETRVEVAERMVAAITEYLVDLPSGATLVVTTHGGSARAAIGQLLELPPPTWGCLGVLSNCAWSILTENSTGHGPLWRLQEYNAGSLPTPALADDR
ncbi:MAG TPA: histidine phosphatase family protein [Candidatus Nanopelagicales bacterium]|nr:histidine phosphatase family protein [Candidatus Nanopelagicales bacterium]